MHGANLERAHEQADLFRSLKTNLSSGHETRASLHPSLAHVQAQLHIVENSKANPQGAMLDPYVVVFLTRNREGSKQKTSVQKKSLSPVWNQSLVFNELNYNDELRVEIKANRQFQVNDFLCGFDFIVADVMAQSVQECQPSYRLVGEKVWS